MLSYDIGSIFHYIDKLSDGGVLNTLKILLGSDANFGLPSRALKQILVSNTFCVAIFLSAGYYILCPMSFWKLHWPKHRIGVVWSIPDIRDQSTFLGACPWTSRIVLSVNKGCWKQNFQDHAFRIMQNHSISFLDIALNSRFVARL